jgi:hypothetical protein
LAGKQKSWLLMRWSKRRKLGLLLLGAMAALALVLLPMGQGGNGPMRRIYDRIRIGMTADEVLDIAPPDREIGRALVLADIRKTRVWTRLRLKDREPVEAVDIYFDSNQQVSDKKYRSSNFFKARYWFIALLRSLHW